MRLQRFAYAGLRYNSPQMNTDKHGCIQGPQMHANERKYYRCHTFTGRHHACGKHKIILV